MTALVVDHLRHRVILASGIGQKTVPPKDGSGSSGNQSWDVESTPTAFFDGV